MSLFNGEVISLRADNGLYLSRMNRGDSETDPIEAAKTSIDVFSEFTVMVDENGQYSFESLTFQPSADKRSVGVDLRLLRRINRGDTNPIEAARSSLDVFSKFTIIPTLDE